MATSTTAQTLAQAPAISGRRWWILAACCLATCAKNTEPPPWIFHPPAMRAFNEGWATYGLIMSALTLGALAFLLIGGVLGDIFGRRRLLLIGLGGLMVCNLLAVFSPSVPWFVVTRLAAGAFGILVLPLSLAMLFLAFADDVAARTRAIAIYILFTNTAFLIAGLLGQLMYSLFDWRASFVVPTLLAVVAFWLARREISESFVARERYVDVIGHAAWALIVLSLLFGFVAWGIDRTYSWVVVTASLVAVVIGVALLVWWDRHTKESIIGQSKIKRRALIILILFGLCMQFGFVGLSTQVRNVLQVVYGYGVVLATVALAPLVIGMFAMVLYGARRPIRASPRALLSGGLLAGAAICLLTTLTRAAGSWPLISVMLLAFGAVMVLANITWTAVFLLSLPNDVVGVRTGINSSVFQVGGSLGNSLPATMVATVGLAQYTQMLLAAGVPRLRIDEALGALNSVLDPATPDAALNPAVSERLVAGYQLAYLMAYDRVLLILAVILAIGSLLAWFGLPRERAAIYAAEEPAS